MPRRPGDFTIVEMQPEAISVIEVGFQGPPGQLDPADRAKLEAALAAADATISSAPDNRLKLEPDGLYVPPPQLASENW